MVSCGLHSSCLLAYHIARRNNMPLPFPAILGLFAIMSLWLPVSASARWAMVCDDGNVQLNEVPAELSREAAALRDQRQTPKSIALTPSGGWVVLFGKHGYMARNAPGK